LGIQRSWVQPTFKCVSFVTDYFVVLYFDFHQDKKFFLPQYYNDLIGYTTQVVPSALPAGGQEQVISLGANIYGKVRTLFATYTYFTTDLAGSIAKSMEVITQVKISMHLFWKS